MDVVRLFLHPLLHAEDALDGVVVRGVDGLPLRRGLGVRLLRARAILRHDSVFFLQFRIVSCGV